MGEKSIWKNVVYNFIKTISNVIFPLLSFSYVSRVLGPEGIGKYTFSSTYVSYYVLLASLGITTYAIRECASVRSNQKAVDQLSSEIISINICTMIISYSIMIGTLYLFSSLREYRILILILSGNIVFTIIGADWINSAFEDFKYITVRTFVFQLLSFIFITIFVKHQEDTVVYAIISISSIILANVCNLIYRRRLCRTRFTLRMRWKTHFPPIVTLFVMLLVQTIFSSSDITIIGLFRSDYEVGLYNVAVKVFSILTSLIASVMWVVLPKLTIAFSNKNYDEINYIIKDIFQLMFGIGLPCIVGVAMLSKEVVFVLGGADYIGAEGYLVLLMIALFFSLIGGSVLGNMIMLPSKREKYFLIACFVAAVVNIILNLMFVPRFGARAAAITTILSHVIILCLLIPRVEKEISFGFLPKAVVPPIIGCGYIIIVIVIVKRFIDNPVAVILGSIFVSSVGYFCILYFLKYELMQKIISGIRNKTRKGDE